jgi:hypothetical protein
MLIGLLAPAFAQAAPPSNLYLEAAGVASYCDKRELTPADFAVLASRIGTLTGEPISIDEVMRRTSKAREAFAAAGDCSSPSAQVHLQFFKRMLLPNSASAPEKALTAG